MASSPSHCFASKLCLPALARKLPTRSLIFFNPLASAKRLSCAPAKKLRFPVIVASASSIPSQIAPPPTSQVPTRLSLTDSTRTLKTLLSITLSASLLLVKAIQELGVRISQKIALNPSSRENLLSAAGPLFFASVRDQPSGYLNTPLTVVAAGLAKWLDIYSAVLMVRVLLSWFPNIPWDRQPLSAIRDLCDPYLNLFRNIIPPVFDTLDVSPLLAFAVLGVLGGILHNSKGV